MSRADIVERGREADEAHLQHVEHPGEAAGRALAAAAAALDVGAHRPGQLGRGAFRPHGDLGIRHDALAEIGHDDQQALAPAAFLGEALDPGGDAVAGQRPGRS